VRDAVVRALAEDVAALGDLSAALVAPTAQGQLFVIARAEGVIAGQRCAEAAFTQMDPELRVRWHRPTAPRWARATR